MIRRSIAVVVGIGLSMNLLGCAHRVTDFTIISTKNVSLAVEKGKRVKGEACAVLAKPDLKQAIDNAIQSAGDDGGDMLMDGVVTYEDRFFKNCYIVEGNIVSSTETGRP